MVAGAGSRRNARRQLVRDRLQAWDLAGLRSAYQQDPGLVSVLLAQLNELDEGLRWRAVHGLGQLLRLRAGSDLEAVRELIRRQFWAMNDDSGNIAWHAPEAIAEILYQVPALCAEYGANLMARLDEELFRPGVLWGAARLAAAHPELVQEHLPQLLAGLADPDPDLCAHAAIALAGGCAFRESQRPRPELCAAALEALDQLRHDRRETRRFDESSGELRACRVGELVSELLAEETG